MSGPDAAVLSISGLRVSYPGARGRRVAVDGVDLEVGAGELVGLVGESGSGKTSVARAALRLIEIDAGRVELDGVDLRALKARDLRRLRSRAQMIFQEPGAALDPRMRAGEAIAEPLLIHRLATVSAARQQAVALLGEVGLGAELAERYPHELSGGQKQRVVIARALASSPRLLVADEPVSALDVSVRGQVVNLLLDLQQRRGLAILFISHDLTLVSRVAGRIAVMYGGRVVEEGAAPELVGSPLHPYAVALLTAGERPLAGEPARGSVGTAAGCRFAWRCPIAVARCRAAAPDLRLVAGRFVACHDPGGLKAPSGTGQVEPFGVRDVINDNAETGANQ